jgi:hypothetical protein
MGRMAYAWKAGADQFFRLGQPGGGGYSREPQMAKTPNSPFNPRQTAGWAGREFLHALGADLALRCHVDQYALDARDPGLDPFLQFVGQAMRVGHR